MRFDYVTLDLDGTLLDDQKKVPADNIKAILRLHREGVCFIICTNRNISEVHTMVPSAITDIVSYFVCRDGLYIYNNEKKLKDFNLLRATDIGVITGALQISPLYCIGSKRHYYVFASLLQLIKTLIKRGKDYKGTSNTTVFFSKLLHYQFEKVMLFQNVGVAPENIAKIKDKYVVNYINNTDYDIFQQGVNKYNALLWLSQNKGVDLDKLLYFGDDSNDEYCFSQLKHVVVMGNASPELKKYSSIENVATNNEAGVYWSLKQLFNVD